MAICLLLVPPDSLIMLCVTRVDHFQVSVPLSASTSLSKCVADVSGLDEALRLQARPHQWIWCFQGKYISD